MSNENFTFNPTRLYVNEINEAKGGKGEKHFEAQKEKGKMRY